MTAALLYWPPKSWHLWTAFACAVAIHLVAVSASWRVAEIPSNFWPIENSGEVTIDPTPDETPVPPIELTPIEPSEVKTDDEFPQDSVTPVPAHLTVRKPISRLARPGVSGSSFGSVRALAIYSPRPAYPYEARKHRTMGTGSVVLIVDLSTGNVIEARMAQSTGSSILDNSAVSGLRTWRFKPGTVSSVRVPITYTLSGVSY